MRWKVISASVRGSSHERTGMPNQDAVDYGIAPKSDPAATVLAVSDGHGSGRHFRSQIGATLAVHTTVQTVRDSLTANSGAALSDLTRKIVDAWLAAVASDLANNPFSEAELATLEQGEGLANKDSVVANPQLAYGATILVAAATDDRLFYLQLGDGDILAVAPDGKTTRPMPDDARLTGNATTSLCQPEAWKEFRTAEIKTGDGLPVLILLSTDGYLNSFRTQEDFLQIGKDYLEILREQGSDSLADELPQILKDATKQGSGDDITLGMMHAQIIPPASAAAGAAKPAANGMTRSALVRALDEERSTQQKKITELESNVAGARKHVVQLRVLIAAVVLAVVGFVTQQYWMPLIRAKSSIPADPGVRAGGGDKDPVKGKKDPDPKAGPGKTGDPGLKPTTHPNGDPVKTDSKSPADKKKQYSLVVSDEKTISLRGGETISLRDLSPKEKNVRYAEVNQHEVLMLKNVSNDTWTAQVPGAKAAVSYASGSLVTLRDGTEIDFHHKGLSATVHVN